MVRVFLPSRNKPVEFENGLDKNIFIEQIVPLINSLPSDCTEEVKIELSNYKNKIMMRHHTSDVECFYQVFIRDDYDIPVNLARIGLIVDGGANVGYSSIYFADRFPEAKVIAIEPEESNFMMLKKNTTGYKNVEQIRSAIWNKETYLKVKDIGLDKWGFIIEEFDGKNSSDLRTTTLKDILKNSGYRKIDILKLDIEGSEKEIFCNECQEWLSSTNIIIIELHDRIKEGCSRAFYSAIQNYDCEINHIGENIVVYLA